MMWGHSHLFQVAARFHGLPRCFREAECQCMLRYVAQVLTAKAPSGNV